MASWDHYRYAIRVQGHLDPHWSEWMEGMTITHEEGGVTLLEGAILDPSALRGLLNKLQDLCLPLLELQRLKVVISTHPGTGPALRAPAHPATGPRGGTASVKKGHHSDGNNTA